MKNKKVVKAPAKSKAVTQKNKDLMWAGGVDVLSRLEADKGKRSSILLVAQALQITPFGVNLLGGLPYINNLGLKHVLFNAEPEANFEYRWVRRSETDDDKAICEARLIRGDKFHVEINGQAKELTDWIAGEASPASMKMGTLKGYQNHLAQTRAENRCIRAYMGLRAHQALLQGVAKAQEQGADPKEAAKAGLALSASTEEMSGVNKAPTVATTATGASDPMKLAMDMIEGTRDVSKLDAMEKRIKQSKAYSEEQKKRLYKMISAKITGK